MFDAFNRHRRVFSPLYCNMLKAGEASGALNDVLDRLTYIIDHEHKVKSDIKAALMYPIIVVCFLVIAFFVLVGDYFTSAIFWIWFTPSTFRRAK